MKDKDQARRFEEAARETGADESGDAFERAFKAMVPPKRRPADAPKTPGRRPAEKRK